MNGARHQFLTRSALPVYQYRAIGGRDPRQELVDVLHDRAFADEAVLKVDLGVEPLVLLAQPLQLAGVFQGDSGDARYGGDELQVVFVETQDGIGRIEVDTTDHLVKHD